MTSNKKIKNGLPPKPVNPFIVPEGYFDSLSERVMDKIRNEEVETKLPSRIISMRPYLTLAASISGLALIIYVILQSVTGSVIAENNDYDMVTLHEAGITADESVIAESFRNAEEDSYSEWDKETMNYLASNEVDLIHLLESQ